MEVGPYDIALIGGGFTIVGALITFLFANQLSRRQARREAGRRLRDAFADEVAIMNPVTGKTNVMVEELLQRAYLKHYAAVQEFAFHLSARKRKSLEDAWRKYYEVGGSVRFFDYYMSDDGREEFRRRVDALFKFTET